MYVKTHVGIQQPASSTLALLALLMWANNNKMIKITVAAIVG